MTAFLILFLGVVKPNSLLGQSPLMYDKKVVGVNDNWLVGSFDTRRESLYKNEFVVGSAPLRV